MKLFYRLKNQRAQGPFSLEEMTHWVRTEELNALDPIFREGDEKWRPLSEFAEFRPILQEIKTKKELESWVLLVKKAPNKKGYIQKGPFSTEQIREMLQAGDILYTDHIWKKGMSEWKKVSSIEEFNPPTPVWDLPPPPQVFPPLPDSQSGKELLKKVIKKPHSPPPEPKPSDAEGENLASPKSVAQAPQQIHITVNQPPAAVVTPAPTVAPVARKTEPPKETTHVRVQISDEDQSNNWWIHLIVIAVVMGFAGYYLMVTSKPNLENIVRAPEIKKVVEPDPEPESTAPAEPIPSPAPEPVVTAPVQVPVRAPRTLKIETGGRRTGKIVVKSDASPHFDLKVELSASFGEVVGKRSEMRKRTFDRVSFPYELDLGNIVAPGYYNLKLDLGDRTYKSRVWVNPTGKDIRPSLQRYIKQNVFGFINEKRKLVRLLKKWQDSGQPDPSRDVAEFNRKNRVDLYYLPQYWREAYELSTQSKSAQWNKSVQKLRSEVIYAHPYGAMNSR